MFRHTKLKPYCHAVALSLLLGLGGKACAEIHDHPQTNVVLGHRATANGLNAVAIGAGATASEEQSIAIGAEFMRFGGGATPILDRRNAAPVARHGGIAIGTGSRSDTAGDVNFGSRKLSGLLDGVADDEAVTMRQFKAAQPNQANPGAELASVVASEGARTLSEAKTYTDTSTIQAVSAANNYANEQKASALMESKAYTDTARNELTTYAGEQKASALMESKAYTDTARNELTTYAGEQKSAAIKAANAYTDLMRQEALADGKAYIDQRLASISLVDEGKLLATASELTDMRNKQTQEQAVRISRRYTDERFSQLQSQMKRLRKRANAGISGAMAMTALTPPPSGSNTSFGMAMAGYRKQLAIASGLTFRFKDKQNLRLNTAWDSSGGIGIAAGFNMAW